MSVDLSFRFRKLQSVSFSVARFRKRRVETDPTETLKTPKQGAFLKNSEKNEAIALEIRDFFSRLPGKPNIFTVLLW